MIVCEGHNERLRDSLRALYDYAYGVTTSINYRLRRDNPTCTDIELSHKISFLETFMELPILYRATLWKYFTDDYGITKDNIHSKVGEVILDKGYLSASKDRRVPKLLYPVDSDTLFMRIFSDGKHRAIDVNETLGEDSPWRDQKEVILGMNTRFTITKISKCKGITYIDVKLKS